MNRLCRYLAGGVLALILSASLGAAETLREFDSEAEKRRYKELLEEVRCLVCQNESLASSSADLAQDLRDEVYRLVVVEDRSREATIEFLTARYGDFVLYRPPVKPTTWLLWFGPLAMLLVGGLVAVAIVRQRTRAQPLTSAEHERARRLLEGDDSDEDAHEREAR